MRSVREWKSVKLSATTKNRLEVLRSSTTPENEVWSLDDMISFLIDAWEGANEQKEES